jgi:hypothetical protein
MPNNIPYNPRTYTPTPGTFCYATIVVPEVISTHDLSQSSRSTRSPQTPKSRPVFVYAPTQDETGFIIQLCTTFGNNSILTQFRDATEKRDAFVPLAPTMQEIEGGPRPIRINPPCQRQYNYVALVRQQVVNALIPDPNRSRPINYRLASGEQMRLRTLVFEYENRMNPVQDSDDTESSSDDRSDDRSDGSFHGPNPEHMSATVFQRPNAFIRPNQQASFTHQFRGSFHHWRHTMEFKFEDDITSEDEFIPASEICSNKFRLPYVQFSPILADEPFIITNELDPLQSFRDEVEFFNAYVEIDF